MEPDGQKFKCSKEKYLEKCREQTTRKMYRESEMVDFANWFAQKQYEEQGNAGNAIGWIGEWGQYENTDNENKKTPRCECGAKLKYSWACPNAVCNQVR